MISPNMARRIGVAAIGIPLAALLLYLGGWVLASAIGLLATVGWLEFQRLATARGVRLLPVPGLLGAALMPVLAEAVMMETVALAWVPALAALWVLSIAGGALAARGPDAQPLASASTTMWASVYTGGLSSAVVVLRAGPETPTQLAAMFLVLLPLACVWICDSVAMATGSRLKGPRFAPVVSPNKTWSGTVAGALAALATAPLYGRVILEPVGVDLGLAPLLAVGAAAGTLGQLGDLAESLFKRDAGIKDSGTFFPGHGGVLDRLDSLYWVLPGTAVIFMLFGLI